MADAAAARREARRRKILENSHNRLQLISGKNVDETNKESSSRAPISEPVHDTPITQESSHSHKCTPNNGIINTGDSLGFTLMNNEDNVIGGGDVTSLSRDLAALVSSSTPFVAPSPPVVASPSPFVAPATPEPTQTQPLLERLVNNKYDVVLLSLLIQILYSYSLINFNDTHFFLPLVIYVTTKLIWFPKQHSSNFAHVLLLLNGMSSNRMLMKLQKILLITQWVSAFSQDLCVFLFTAICVQYLVQFLSNLV